MRKIEAIDFGLIRKLILAFVSCIVFIALTGVYQKAFAQDITETEPNNTFATATIGTIDSWCYGSLHRMGYESSLFGPYPGEADYFKIEIPESGEYTFTFVNDEYYKNTWYDQDDYFIRFYDQYYEEVGDRVKYAMTTTRPQISYITLEKGAVYVKIYGDPDFSREYDAGPRPYHFAIERMKIGWIQTGSHWQYYYSNGNCAVGWKSISGKWYYFDSDGIMQVGWTNIGGTWYYMNSNGVMLTGWQQIGANWYYFNGSGVMQTGWLPQGSSWYYLKSGGAMATGWQKVANNWYYLNGSGVMQTGWFTVGNHWYYSNASGVMQSNRWVGNYWVGSSGAMATNTTVDGGRYRVGSDGLWIK